MDLPSDSTTLESLPSTGRVHVVGAGPVGLLLTALLQSMDGVSVRLYEKRREYTRTRMVQLAPYLMADSVETYRADAIDGDSVEAIFDPSELERGLAFRQSIPSELSALLKSWALGFCPLNSIEQSLSDLIDARGPDGVERMAAVVTAKDAIAMLQPGDVLIDSTGSRSLLRDQLVLGADDVDGANTVHVRLEYALVITFLYGQPYDCNESCKYYKNIENAHYKFIPMVHRTHFDGSVSHVTGIVNISAAEFEAMPSRVDGEWLRSNFPGVAESMDRFIDKVKEETTGRYSATSRSSGYHWICIARATRRIGSGSRRRQASILLPPPRCSSPATRPSARRTFSQFRLASSVRCSSRGSSRNATCRCK